MKSLVEHLNESLSRSVNESNFSISDVVDYCNAHLAMKKTITAEDVVKRADKFDILPSAPVTLVVGERDEFPQFKIGKLNGYLKINYATLDNNVDHLVDECGGISFCGVKGGKRLKNLTIKINSKYQKAGDAENGIDFWKCAGLLSSVKNITLDFTEAPGCGVGIDMLKPNSLKNINFENCECVRSNSEAKVELDDIKHIKGLSKIRSNSGDVEANSFYFNGKEWVQGIQKQFNTN